MLITCGACGSTAFASAGGPGGWTAGAAGGGPDRTAETTVTGAGALASTAAGWLVTARVTSATSQLAACCRPPSRRLGALRPRSTARISVVTATVNRAHAIQLMSRTAPRKTVPLSRCSSSAPAWRQAGM